MHYAILECMEDSKVLCYYYTASVICELKHTRSGVYQHFCTRTFEDEALTIGTAKIIGDGINLVIRSEQAIAMAQLMQDRVSISMNISDEMPRIRYQWIMHGLYTSIAFLAFAS